MWMFVREASENACGVWRDTKHRELKERKNHFAGACDAYLFHGFQCLLSGQCPGQLLWGIEEGEGVGGQQNARRSRRARSRAHARFLPTPLALSHTQHTSCFRALRSLAESPPFLAILEEGGKHNNQKGCAALSVLFYECVFFGVFGKGRGCPSFRAKVNID